MRKWKIDNEEVDIEAYLRALVALRETARNGAFHILLPLTGLEKKLCVPVPLSVLDQAIGPIVEQVNAQRDPGELCTQEFFELLRELTQEDAPELLFAKRSWVPLICWHWFLQKESLKPFRWLIAKKIACSHNRLSRAGRG